MPLDQISARAFKKHTSAGLIDRRGSTLKMIDAALECWDEYTGNDEKEKCARLYLVYKNCGKYVKKYHLTQTGYTGMVGGSKLRVKRLEAAKTMQDLVLDKIAQIAPGVSKAFQQFLLNKQRVKPLHLRQLDDTYRNERGHYLQNKQMTGGKPRQQLGNLNPYSGTSVHTMHDQWLNMGRRDKEKIQGEKRDLIEFLRENPDVPVEMDLFKLIGLHGGNWKVSYLNKIQRMRYMAILEPDGRFKNIDDAYIDLQEKYMYAVDHYGCMYIAPMADNDALERTLELTGRQEDYFNHSSFNSGREVMCAGIVYIRDGWLRYIDNNSGHYRPTKEHLKELLIFLQSEGVPLNEVGTWYHGVQDEIAAEPFTRDLEQPWPGSHRMRANVRIFSRWGNG